MSRRTFFVINVHNRAADGELVTALERIAEALSNLPTAVAINNPAADPVKAVTDAAQYLKAYVDLDDDPVRRALIFYRVAAKRFEEATREYDQASDDELRRLAARKVDLQHWRLDAAWVALDEAGYFDLANREAAGDE